MAETMERTMEGLRKDIHFENAVRKLRVGLVVFALALSGITIILTSLTSVPVVASSWGPRVLITDDNLNNTDYSKHPSVGVDGFGNIHIVWDDRSDLDGGGPDYDVYYKRWDFSTESWSPRVLVSKNSNNDSASPVISIDSFGNIHVVWRDSNDSAAFPYRITIQHRMWNASTGNWMGVDFVANETMTQFRVPRISADPFGNVHLIAESSGATNSFYYMKWHNVTNTWGEVSLISGGGTSVKKPRLAVDHEGNVHVVWRGGGDILGSGMDTDIYYRKLNRSIDTWMPVELVTNDNANNTESSDFPEISTDPNGNLHVVWQDNSAMDDSGTDSDIFYKRYDATVSEWGHRFPVSNDNVNNTRWSVYAEVAADPFGNAHIVWEDYSDLDGSGTDIDLFYRKWNISTGSLEKRFPLNDPISNMYSSIRQCVATDPLGNVHIAWEDAGLEGGLDVDIYYRKWESGMAIVPFVALRTEVVNVDDIVLKWTASGSFFVDHFLIFRSPDQRGFDFSTPIHNTSGDINRLRTTWVDIDAASSVAPREYYYIVRAVTQSGEMSITSNTAGKWTRSFSKGRDAFSLPLEPFMNRNVSWYSENIPGTEFVRWMNETGHWVNHYPSTGKGVNDIPATMGDSYEISLSSPINFTFCGYPASMIRFHGGLGDSLTFARSLSAQADGNDVSLTWEAAAGADSYLVFRSVERNGLHDLSLLSIANTTETYWVDSDVIGSGRSEYYYMVIPANPSGGLGSSTYSVGLFTVGYQSGSDSFALPLKPVETHALDWYCDNIPNMVGIVHLMKGYWRLHAREMPEGVYDAEAVQGEGYQILFVGGTTSHTFIGS